MDPVEEIKNKLDIKDVIGGYIKLEKSGINYRALCPFHKEKTPSFFVSPTRQLWRCFGCGEGGDMFTFVESIEGVGFPEALRLLAQRAGVEVKRQDPRVRSEKNKALEMCELAAKYFQHQLESKNGQLVTEYLKERGLSDKTIEEFKIGYAPHNATSLTSFLNDRKFGFEDMVKAGLAFYSEKSGQYISRFRGRITFPIFNGNGDVVGFGARKLSDDLLEKMGKSIIPDSAKYINSPQTIIYDKSNILYGLDKAKMAIRQEDACIVVEGYTDVILAHQNGYKNVVAASGTALTENQIRLINRFTTNLFTCFDMDVAGDTATRRGIDTAQAMGLDVKVVTLEEGKDPADLIQEDKEAWSSAVKEARSVPQFYLESALKKYNPKTPEGKRDIVKVMSRVLVPISSKVEQAHWIQEVATRLGVSEEDVMADVNAAKDKNKDISSKNEEKPRARSRITKKELLLQHILISVIKDPSRVEEAIKSIEENDIKNSVPGRVLKIISDSKSEEDQIKAIREAEKAEKDMFDQLIFELEVNKENIDWSDSAFKSFLMGYRELILDEELQELHRKIKISEQEGKEEKELIDMFNKKIIEKNNIKNKGSIN